MHGAREIYTMPSTCSYFKFKIMQLQNYIRLYSVQHSRSYYETRFLPLHYNKLMLYKARQENVSFGYSTPRPSLLNIINFHDFDI